MAIDPLKIANLLADAADKKSKAPKKASGPKKFPTKPDADPDQAPTAKGFGKKPPLFDKE